MTKDLVISANRHETKVAILEDEQLVEIYFQRANEYSLVGSIHKGRVTRVLPGMQSAFVDIGLERDAFLYVSDFFAESEEYEELPGAEKKTRSKTTARKEKEPETVEPAESRKERRGRRSRRRRGRAEGLPESKYASMAAIEKEERAPREEGPVGGIVPLPGESLAKYGGPVPVTDEEEPESAPAAEAPREAIAEADLEGGAAPSEPIEPGESPRDLPSEAAETPRTDRPEEAVDAGLTQQSADGSHESAGEGPAGAEPTEQATATADQEPPAPDRASATGQEMPEGGAREKGTEREEEASAELRVRDESDLRIDSDPDEDEPGDTGGGNPGTSSESPEDVRGAAGEALKAENPANGQESGPSGAGLENDTAETSPAGGEDEPAPASEAVAENGERTLEPEVDGEDEAAEDEGTVESVAGEDEDDRFPVRTKLLSHRRFTRPTRGGAETSGEDEEIQRMILDRLEDTAGADETVTTAEDRGAEERKRGRRSARRRGRNRNAGAVDTAGAEETTPAETESRRPQRGSRRGRRRDRADEASSAARQNGSASAERTGQPSISELLKEGQEILVQIAKEPLGQKGARITSHIALPGRYVVYMPTLDHLGVSRKIAGIRERQRLRRILQEQRKGMPGGFIVRTAGEGKSEEEIAADMKFLYNLWLDIREKAEKKKSPALLHHDLQVVERVLRDQVNEEFTSIWVDHEETYEEVLRFLERFQPELMKRVRLYTRSEPIFDAFNISQELEKALRPKVWLKSGGYIVINQTEALVAIDINTGKYVGKSNRLEDTIVKTNIEAVKEIVRQIRLRDLGGIIVVDFIDMEERKSRQKVMQALEEAMRADRAPYKILQFNDFGLVAITRKRAKQSLERTLCMPCPYCEGAAYVKSVETVLSEILNEAQKLAGALEGEDVVLRVHPDVAKRLKDPRSGYLEELEEILNRPVLVKADPLLHHEKFDLV